MFAVAGIDALRRIADEEIPPPLHSGMLLDDGDADLFGSARIDGGFEDHGGATFQVAADCFARPE
jgi:hypothetical protein